jgi:hypothetical protein
MIVPYICPYVSSFFISWIRNLLFTSGCLKLMVVFIVMNGVKGDTVVILSCRCYVRFIARRLFNEVLYCGTTIVNGAVYFWEKFYYVVKTHHAIICNIWPCKIRYIGYFGQHIRCNKLICRARAFSHTHEFELIIGSTVLFNFTVAAISVESETAAPAIPGLDISDAQTANSGSHGTNVDSASAAAVAAARRKNIYTKPIPKEFERAWAECRPVTGGSGPTEGSQPPVGLLGDMPG